MTETADEVPENADVCIVGHERVSGGYKVKEDRVLGFLRALKSRLGMKVRNNRLFVCEAHKEEYMKKRKGFERNLTLLAALSAIFLVIMFAVGVMHGDIMDIARTIFLSILLLILVPLVLVFLYVPAIEDKPVQQANAPQQAVKPVQQQSEPAKQKRGGKA
jgi:hypothetical protein